MSFSLFEFKMRDYQCVCVCVCVCERERTRKECLPICLFFHHYYSRLHVETKEIYFLGVL